MSRPDLKPRRLGMRAILIVMAGIKVKAFLMSELAARIAEETGCSRATSWRCAREAIDELGVHYDQREPQRWERLMARWFPDAAEVAATRPRDSDGRLNRQRRGTAA